MTIQGHHHHHQIGIGMAPGVALGVVRWGRYVAEGIGLVPGGIAFAVGTVAGCAEGLYSAGPEGLSAMTAVVDRPSSNVTANRAGRNRPLDRRVITFIIKGSLNYNVSRKLRPIVSRKALGT
jgi:hypothetical protein